MRRKFVRFFAIWFRVQLWLDRPPDKLEEKYRHRSEVEHAISSLKEGFGLKALCQRLERREDPKNQQNNKKLDSTFESTKKFEAHNND